jgi:hypothetical protein
MGGFLTMGLIGIVIASLVNLFFQSSDISSILSYIGIRPENGSECQNLSLKAERASGFGREVWVQ